MIYLSPENRSAEEMGELTEFLGLRENLNQKALMLL